MPTKAQVVKRIEDTIETATAEQERLRCEIVDCNRKLELLQDRIELLSAMLEETDGNGSGEGEDEAPDFNKVATQ